QPSSTFSLLPSPIKPGDLGRKHRTVSSRAAENLFWSGRYGERAENNVRLLRLILGSLENNDADVMFSTLVELALQSGLVPVVDMLPERSPQAFERTLVANLNEHTGASSIGQNLAAQARANGEIRGRLSSDHWRTIVAARNDFRDALTTLTPAPAFTLSMQGGRHDRYDRVALMQALEHLSTQLSAISGAQGDRMTRDEAWRLLFVGRHIERISAMTTTLRIVAEARQLAMPEGFDLLLQLFDSTLTYRSMYPGRFEVPALLDLLVVEPTNPRGLYGVYERLCSKLDEITVAAGTSRHTSFVTLMPSVETLPSLEQLCSTDADGNHAELVDLCNDLNTFVAVAANEISARYFSHANTLASRVSS
ncbi:MAG: alpha-E domain-containing protein, partial [Paraburkholderia sp.]|nr:alpha-E domain-containing protein [Paraburkholderia sp.]